MQYFGILASHFGSSANPHSPLPTKFPYACHRFVSQCTPNLNWVHIKSFNMRHAWNICWHLWCGPWVACTMSKIPIGLNVSPMVKGDFHRIAPCVKPIDGKVGQTIMIDWPHVVGVFMVVLWLITTFIFTKHNFH